MKIEWSVEESEEAPRLVFDWVETGVTLSGEEPKRHGFGTELIERTLAYELGGEASLRFELGGLSCTLILPITDQIIMGQTYPVRKS